MVRAHGVADLLYGYQPQRRAGEDVIDGDPIGARSNRPCGGLGKGMAKAGCRQEVAHIGRDDRGVEISC